MSPLTESARVVLKQPTGASWTITPTNLLPDDADAVAYIAAVEAADGEALEPAVRLAINSFVKGCKADGIWPAIKASCILAGARTLNGALVPLVGTAPTNYNFVAGDYDRKTGLVGDGSTKYLDSNRNNNADPQNSQHLAAYASTAQSADVSRGYIGSGVSDDGTSSVHILGGADFISARSRSSGSGINAPAGTAAATGFIGLNRSTSSSAFIRVNDINTTGSLTSQTPFNGNILVFARAVASKSNARLAFYSIGEALDLALLDTRVTALVNALAAAIP